jgi:hypothetical protein
LIAPYTLTELSIPQPKSQFQTNMISKACDGSAPAFLETLTGPLSEKYGSLPKFPLPGDDLLLSQSIRILVEVLKDKPIYRRDSQVVYLYKERARLMPMDAACFRSWVEEFCVGYKVRYDIAGNPYHVLRTMTKDVADGVLNSMKFWQGLREIENVNPCRLPVMRENGEIELIPAGYDTPTKTLTFKL